MFEFLKSDSKTSDNAASLGGLSASAEIRVEDSESAKTLRTAKPKGDKQSESGTGTSSVSAGDRAAIEQQVKALEDLLDPKVWKSAMGAPGDAMVVITGKQYWELSVDEKDALAKTGVATARCFMMTDPKWLALSLFGFSIISIYGSRCMKEMLDRKAAKENVLPKAP